MITGEQLRLLRQIHNIKQEQMAKALQITQQRYSMLEKLQLLPAEKTEKVLATLNLSLEDAHSILNTLPPPQ